MAGLLQLIEAERRSDTVNRLLLQHLLRMLTALGIYEDAFQVRWKGKCGASEFILSAASHPPLCAASPHH